MQIISAVRERFEQEKEKWGMNRKTPVEKAIQWAKNYTPSKTKGGIIPHRRKNVLSLTQETAGYLISTLYTFGEKEFARELMKWEVSLQRPDGAFSAIDGVPYTFDTAQVVRGFLSTLDDLPEMEENLRRACDYIEEQIVNQIKGMRTVIHQDTASGYILFYIPSVCHIHVPTEHQTKVYDATEAVFFQEVFGLGNFIKETEFVGG